MGNPDHQRGRGNVAALVVLMSLIMAGFTCASGVTGSIALAGKHLENSSVRTHLASFRKCLDDALGGDNIVTRDEFDKCSALLEDLEADSE